MKTHITKHYQTDLKEFTSWLEVLSYSKGTIHSAEQNIREFFTFIEHSKVFELDQINQSIIDRYFKYLQNRSNQKTGGGLSPTTLRKHRSSLVLVFQHLRKTRSISIKVELPFIASERNTPGALSINEIKLLYASCQKDVLGLRDSAMLALYYGCGLRRSEGTNLNVTDVDLIKGQLLVQKSKTTHQRYVPLSKGTVKHLETYLFESREHFLASNNNEQSFLVSSRGNRMHKETATYRLNKLIADAAYPPFNEKQVSIHVLRHSIGTHLLRSGMPLEDIALFLGHKSLDSTQIYTHLATR
jgi:integrase/recombinase XerD